MFYIGKQIFDKTQIFIIAIIFFGFLIYRTTNSLSGKVSQNG